MPSYLRSFSTPAVVDDNKVAVERQVGVVTRICSFKYGFIQTSDLQNIFFHFSELSDEAKAVVEPGCKVKYQVIENEWTADKKMKAVNIEVVSTPEQNAYKNMNGVVHRELGPRGFGFIQADSTTYFFPSNELIADAESNKRGNTARAGDRVVFNASWNHKYNPPKPYATNVRLVPLPESNFSSVHPSHARHPRLPRSTSAIYCAPDRSENNSPSSGSDGDAEDNSASMDFSKSVHGSWRGSASNASRRGENRVRTHARGSSLASLLPATDGESTHPAVHSADAPAVGKTSSSRVNRVMGSCKPYSGDSAGARGAAAGMGDAADVPVNNRALALKRCEPPVRMGSRQLSSTAEEPTMSRTESVNGIESDESSATDEDKDSSGSSSSEENAPPASMGETSLRVLVQALVAQGKTQYLQVRNTLQRSEYFGRALTREEKQIVSDILQQTMNAQEGSSSSSNRSSNRNSNKENAPNNANSGRGSMRRQTSRGVRKQNSRSSSLHTQLSRQDSSRPPLSRASSRGPPPGFGPQQTFSGYGGGNDRLSLSERLSTTDRLSLTSERLSLNKSYSHMSSMGAGYDDGEVDGYGCGAGAGAGAGDSQDYSLFDEPMRVSDCLAPTCAP